MTVNEATNMYSPCLSIKFALGVSLFANAISSLGTNRHKKFYEDVWQGKVREYCSLSVSHLCIFHDLTYNSRRKMFQ